MNWGAVIVRLRLGTVPVVPLGVVLIGSTVAWAQDSGDAARGQRLFLQCQACHSLQAAAGGTVGPTLAGVVGRKAASVPGYSYSPALAASGLTWDPSTLDKWLERPTKMVPDTKMIFGGIASPADRAAVIAYLQRSAPLRAQ